MRPTGEGWLEAFGPGGWAAQIQDYAIIALDPSGVVISWNAGAERIKGYRRAEILGQHFSVFYPHDDRVAGLPIALLQTARDQGRVEHSGWRVRRDGSLFWGTVVITAVRDEDGRLNGYVKLTRDRTTEHRQEIELRESEARFRLLVNHVRDYAIIGLDTNGVITSWNHGAQLVTGYDAEDAVGRHFSLFFPPETQAEALPLRMVEVARREGRVEDVGWRMRADGSRFWAEVVMTVLQDDGGSVTGFVMVTRDLTEQHRLDQARELFVAGVTHDFRSPLMSISGFASVVQDLAEDPVLGDYAQRILNNADRLTALVDQLLEHSRMRSGRTRVSLTPTALTPLLRKVIGDLAGLLDQHEVQMVCEEVSVVADEAALTRVLVNLLTNAAKYSPAGSPIRVEARRADGEAEIRVVDRGRGIDAAESELLFQEFERGSRAAEDGGFGLGLAVARHLMGLMDGHVRLDPDPEGGTVATVRLRPA